jgi:hypothetical protein
MNVSGIPFLGFGYKDNQRQDERKKKDFGEILQNEIKKNRLTSDDAQKTTSTTCHSDK